DCKRALEETGGDIDEAKKWLREKGLSAADKRSGRAASEGAVEVIVEGNVGVVVELNCETDFVAKGDTFGDFLNALAQHVLSGSADDIENQPYDGSTVGETVKSLAGTLGENISLGRVVRMESADGIIDGYKHLQNDRGGSGSWSRWVASTPATRRPARWRTTSPCTSPRPRPAGCVAKTFPPTSWRRSARCSPT
ncbi:MAG TPA: translation elongation factor Ts, partial [Acidimicrobiia bacterium]|nr:translation elongation factor Ts [Acidimicrobiia bacterium]